MAREPNDWSSLRLRSERAARDAGLAAGRGATGAARLCGEAADLAEQALAALPDSAVRLYADTAVSAAWLRRRAGDPAALFRLAADALARPDLPAFARCEIQAALSASAGPQASTH